MDIRPILSTLGRHRIAAGLIVLEIALTCAIVANTLYLIQQRLDNLHAASGIAEAQLIRVQITGIGDGKNGDALTREDLVALRGIPGVVDAAVVNQVPFGGSSWMSSFNLAPDQVQPNGVAATYFGDRVLSGLGLQLVAGRDFTADEYRDLLAIQADASLDVPAIILTRTLAQRLFPDGTALGKPLYIWGNKPSRVVGIVDHLAKPNRFGGPGQREYSLIASIHLPYNIARNYVVRVQPGSINAVLKAIPPTLNRVDDNRLLQDVEPYATTRASFFQQDRTMAWLLGTVSLALLVVTALGIVGLASFWVQQRTRQIGVRRALGATRGQIIGYFMTENLILTSIGIVLGMFGAYGLNQVLMSHYELPRLPILYLPIGAALLWLLGQIAVLGPALRASHVPPALATRSV
jgi:putative ABC transport system permease protein